MLEGDDMVAHSMGLGSMVLLTMMDHIAEVVVMTGFERASAGFIPPGIHAMHASSPLP